MNRFFERLLFISPARRRALLRLPLIVCPGLCWIFYTLHGSGGTAGAAPLGLNPQLPQASVSGRQLLDKKLQYEAAERDSVRKAQFQHLDPYRRDSGTIVAPRGNYTGRTLAPVLAPVRPQMTVGPRGMTADPRAAQLLEQLRQLQQSIRQPQAPMGLGRHEAAVLRPGLRASETVDTVGDARVGRLNDMLDKVIRIQHPEVGHVNEPASRAVDEVLPADTTVNAIAAVIPADQTLTAGATIALRITDPIRVNGQLLPGGQLVYGVVSINNDRMLVHIGSLRDGRSLFGVDLQVYDMDGIAGIHIPGVLSRDVAKQSADQGVNSLNVLNADPSLGAEAASAGIQTVKTFLGRKVRQVRVSVRAGYQVLLRETHAGFSRRVAVAPRVVATDSCQAPDFEPTGPVITRCRVEGVELALRGVGLEGGRLWFGLEWTNRSRIGFAPGYARWYIRDRREVRRTAMQKLPLEPVHSPPLAVVPGDSVQHSWTGFLPFVLARDKELVLETGEPGGRVLQLVIKHQQILKATNYGQEKGEAAGGPGDRPL